MFWLDACEPEIVPLQPANLRFWAGNGAEVANLYPREHARLKEAMLARGLLLSEFPPGSQPHAGNFPVRNRIIAGLASGVVVVEASRRSGSLITARLANDFGRDVFAVPGSIFSPTSLGTHELLPRLGRARTPPGDLSAEALRLLEILRREEVATADELSQDADLSAGTVLAALFELEEAGLAGSDETGRYLLLRP